MNEKFYKLSKEKQERIINSAIKSFAVNGYKRASTDTIVKEASIAKGLLFHYFGNKRNLYEFVLEYSTRYLLMELTKGIRKEENELFQIWKQLEENKIRMLKNYPYLDLFLIKAANEGDESVKIPAQEWTGKIKDFHDNIYAQADGNCLIPGLKKEKALSMMTLCMEGYKERMYSGGEEDPARILSGFQEYIDIFEKCFITN